MFSLFLAIGLTLVLALWCLLKFFLLKSASAINSRQVDVEASINGIDDVCACGMFRECAAKGFINIRAGVGDDLSALNCVAILNSIGPIVIEPDGLVVECKPDVISKYMHGRMCLAEFNDIEGELVLDADGIHVYEVNQDGSVIQFRTLIHAAIY